MTSFFTEYPYLTIVLVAFLVNIPLGYWREGSQKFSLSWFFWIHASIPLIIYLRISLHTSKWFIPAAIFVAVLGQMVGAKLRKEQMTEDDLEKYNRISDLNTPVHNPVVPDEKVMVVLMNMGGPRTNSEVKGFLYRLFMDPIILRFPLSQILQPFFAWLIVTLRAKATEERYQLIGGGSPIFESTKQQAKALETELSRRGRNLKVNFCFNYSEPFPSTALAEVKKAGKEYLLPLSLYPHYSLATIGSNLYYLGKEAAANFPGLKFLKSPAYYLHDQYIKAFAQRVQEQLKPGENLSDFYLLFSTHGLPLYFLNEGDPYAFQISQTVSRVLKELNQTDNWSISYQSAVGPLQWLKPATEDVLHALAKRGVKKMIVVPISFVTDHIETLAEIDIEYRAVAEKAGIADFRMSRSLECHPGFITALADTVEQAMPKVHKNSPPQVGGVREGGNQNTDPPSLILPTRGRK